MRSFDGLETSRVRQREVEQDDVDTGRAQSFDTVGEAPCEFDLECERRHFTHNRALIKSSFI
jgi:hypothetical protein